MTIENLLQELIEAVKENTKELKINSELGKNTAEQAEQANNSLVNMLKNTSQRIGPNDIAEKAAKPKKVKEEAKEEVKENPVEKTLAAYAEIKKEEAKEEITVQSAIALAKDKMREGIVRIDIKKKISELKADEIAELTQENLVVFYNWLKDLKAE